VNRRFIVSGETDAVWQAANAYPGPGVDWLGCAWHDGQTSLLVVVAREVAGPFKAAMEEAGLTVTERPAAESGWPVPDLPLPGFPAAGAEGTAPGG
jgi:hypothetical protein